MGTRSLTKIYSEDDSVLLCLYRQYDGYPEGMGADLQQLLAGVTVINGFGLGQAAPLFANGMGCLAAQLVKGLKDCIGNVYIYPTDSKDCGAEYLYHIRLKDGRLRLTYQEGYPPAGKERVLRIPAKRKPNKEG